MSCRSISHTKPKSMESWYEKSILAIHRRYAAAADIGKKVREYYGINNKEETGSKGGVCCESEQCNTSDTC